MTLAVAQTLSSFLPRIVLRSLTESTPIPNAPLARQVRGTALFADISGFAAMTLEKARLGALGAEQIGEKLNEWFGTMIAQVESHGGDVVDFDGDALIVAWTADQGEDSLQKTAVLAYRCGQSILSGLGQATGVQLRIGIATGDMFLSFVGGHNGQWTFVAGGAPFVNMCIASRAAQPGEIVCDAEARRLLDHAQPVAVEELLPVSMSGLTRDQVAAYLPDMLVQRTEAGQWAWMAELRTVSVVFVILRGLDATASQGRFALQSAVKKAQESLALYEGQLNQVLQDDTGHVLLCVFGLPSQSHENDSLLAVRTGMALHGELTALCLSHSIGIATGRAYCGVYGTAARRRYAVVGDVVNLAARVAQHTQDGVRCDETTTERTHTRVVFEAAELIAAKGRAEPVRASVPLMLRHVTQNPTRTSREQLLGRDAELDALERRLREVIRAAAPAPAVIIEGPAGIGKSMLVSATYAVATSLGFRVSIGTGDAVDRAVPWHAWHPVFERLLGLHAGQTLQERQERVRIAVASLGPMAEWAPLLNGVFPLELPPTLTTSQMSSQVRRSALVDLLVELVQQACAKAPRALIIDDAHWIDEGSWELAQAIVERVSGALVVMVTRPLTTAVPKPYEELTRAIGTTHLRLTPLSEGDLAELVRQVISVQGVAPDLVSFVASKSEGNPFFCRELALTMRDAGQVVVEAGHCRLARDGQGLAQLDVPDTVSGVITQRLDRLHPTELLALKVASVIGRTFAVNLLRDVYPVAAQRGDISKALEELSTAGFLQLEDGVEPPSYGFRHTIIQDAAYDIVPFAQRRQLHSDVAKWIESAREASSESNFAALAHHWKAAGVSDKAIEYCEKAGDAALWAGAHREGVGFFREALDLHDPRAVEGERLAHWHGQIGDGLYCLGRLDQSKHHVLRALRLFGEPMPQWRFGWLWRGVMSVLVQMLLLLWPAHRRRSPSDQERHNLRRSAELISVMGEQYFFEVDMPKMIVAELCAANLAERALAPAVASRPYGALAYLVGLLRMHALARLYFRKAMRGNDARTIANAHVSESLYHLSFGRWQGALDVVSKGMAVASRVGDHFSLELLLNVKADAEHYAGNAEAALVSYRDLTEKSRARHSLQHEIWGLTGSAEVLVNLGRYKEARIDIHRVAEKLEHAHDQLATVRYLGVRAFIALRCAEVSDAEETLEALVALRKRYPQFMYPYVWALPWAAQAAAELQQLDDSRAARRRTRSLTRAAGAFAMVFPFARSVERDRSTLRAPRELSS